jgi:hypothetical protein
MEDGNPTTAQASDEEAKLEDDVLPSTAPPLAGADQATLVIGGKKHYSEPGVGRVVLKLLDDRPATIGLFMQDRRL